MAEKDVWLPESYSQFQKVDSQLHKWSLPSRIIRNAWIGGCIISVINPEYREYFMQPHVWAIEFAAFSATLPAFFVPNFNVPGKRLHRQLFDIGLEICKNDGLPEDGVIGRVRKTLTYTNYIAPVRRGFDPNLTPDQRLNPFPNAQASENLSKADRATLRKALYLGQSFWQVVEKSQELPQRQRDYAKSMLDEITSHLAYLSIDRHFSF